MVQGSIWFNTTVHRSNQPCVGLIAQKPGVIQDSAPKQSCPNAQNVRDGLTSPMHKKKRKAGKSGNKSQKTSVLGILEQNWCGFIMIHPPK